ncbi:MAG TPA: PhzF family phenazine biosynthesis protein, partial [Bacillota bacterium]|nr:PhzF family phenazine biosynthesis protein [Bacillota bacterium]
MARLPFYIVDVFAETKYSGNQLAVFLNAGGLTATEMQRIAGEINYSETTFVLTEQPQSDGYPVRIFTPAEELPFAGHPVLGTAEVIRHALLKETVSRIKLNLNVGQIPVEYSRIGTGPEILWMHQNPPVFGTVEEDRSGVARVLGLNEIDLNSRVPIQEVSTGLPFIIVPVQSLQGVRKAKVDQ